MEVFERKASENKYLHRDFHISMNMLMEYICVNFGEDSLTEYLRTFSREFHKQRKAALIEKGLTSLKEYFDEIYFAEECDIEISINDHELKLSQKECPGISHIRKNGFSPIAHYMETYTTVYEELCVETPYEYKMIEFDDETGACTQVFTRRSG